MLKFSTDDIRCITLLENQTGAEVVDCIVDTNAVTFVVKKGCMGLAIGKSGDNVKRIERAMGKKIEIVEHSPDAAEFVGNAFQPVKITSCEITEKNGRKIACVEVPVMNKGLAIGKNGKNIEKVKLLAHRHHGVDDVVIR
jgi:N utilization substance protein A